ncbi:hypothetical protein [Kitasatospora cineracea]|uniref:Uncharacterized protein n=1 Tax=Kitasatospora cineracea TaxID=88074 RepID=A0A3N4QZY4_9ACTN|nr:hypothetical protein [Kitasatospora cineracea]RPE26578.1 hypothetical protein EDD38_7639 [Kitasatospora cineracea]
MNATTTTADTDTDGAEPYVERTPEAVAAARADAERCAAQRQHVLRLAEKWTTEAHVTEKRIRLHQQAAERCLTERGREGHALAIADLVEHAEAKAHWAGEARLYAGELARRVVLLDGAADDADAELRAARAAERAQQRQAEQPPQDPPAPVGGPRGARPPAPYHPGRPAVAPVGQHPHPGRAGRALTLL